MSYSPIQTGQRWITTEEGNHVLLNGDGTIAAGFGGGFNGMTFGEAFGGYPQRGGDSSSTGVQGSRMPVYASVSGALTAEPAATSKELAKIVKRLNTNIDGLNAKVMVVGEGSMKRERILLPRENNTLSGGRKEMVDIEISVNSPRKVMGNIHIRNRESNGISFGELLYSSSGTHTAFHSMEDLQRQLESLKTRSLVSSPILSSGGNRDAD